MAKSGSIVKKVLLGLAAILVVILIYAATKPDSFRVERSLVINASPDTLYSLISDFKHFGKWSPWEELDPSMKKTYSGSESGKGAVYEWSGNSDVGSGRMEITDASASKVVMKLNFIEPFEAENMTEITLTPNGNSTTVNWMMYGPSPYISKLMTVFFDMDAAIGKDFEKGLNKLKTLTE